ncbi:MAG TPA: hypothetical protein VJ761_16480, partial [Ktedonobacteraceae bacterium]|nr:hypothetical protein [Ktedonobacteraceae bacterium]
EVLNLLKTPTSLFDPRILAAVLRKEFASRLPKNMKAFTLGSYPSSLFTSDIPVQGLIAAYRQSEKQRQLASQEHVPVAEVEQVGEMERERELQGSRSGS